MSGYFINFVKTTPTARGRVNTEWIAKDSLFRAGIKQGLELIAELLNQSLMVGCGSPGIQDMPCILSKISPQIHSRQGADLGMIIQEGMEKQGS